MANAAWELVRLTGWQIALSIFSLFGLGAAIYYAREAALAGHKSAVAAQHAFNSQVDAERPILQVSDVSLSTQKTDDGRVLVTGQFNFRNFGKSGCWLQGVCRRLALVADWHGPFPEDEFKDDAPFRTTYFVPPGESVFDEPKTVHLTLDFQERRAVETGFTLAILYGYIQYTGLGGLSWRSRFGFIVWFDDNWEYTGKNAVTNPEYWREDVTVEPKKRH